MNTENNTCGTCNRPTDGWKCDKCGVEAREHDDMHGCGGDHCVGKCSECGHAETKCNCPPIK